MGRLPVVLFLPRDITLVTGSPSNRRRYLNIALCQMDPFYCRSLSEYGRVLTQRNALLRDLRERRRPRAAEQLQFWDEQLVKLGSQLTVRRAALVSVLDAQAQRQYRGLSGERDRLQLRYESAVLDRLQLPGHQLALDLDGTERPAVPDVASVSEAYQIGLGSLRQREIGAGMSLLGPHRDEVRFLNGGRDVRAYGSRGQQRSAALAVKLAEVAVMNDRLGQPPVLLLDDVLSELDGARRRALLSLITDIPQAVVTATDWEGFSPAFRRRCRQLRVVDGLVEPVEGSAPQSTGAE
jgi:DNA replication and repair protein RecF